jgi:hypothetical protein
MEWPSPSRWCFAVASSTHNAGCEWQHRHRKKFGVERSPKCEDSEFSSMSGTESRSNHWRPPRDTSDQGTRSAIKKTSLCAVKSGSSINVAVEFLQDVLAEFADRGSAVFSCTGIVSRFASGPSSAILFRPRPSSACSAPFHESRGCFIVSNRTIRLKNPATWFHPPARGNLLRSSFFPLNEKRKLNACGGHRAAQIKRAAGRGAGTSIRLSAHCGAPLIHNRWVGRVKKSLSAGYNGSLTNQDGDSAMLRFVVKRVDDPGGLIRLEILGLPMAEYPYQPGEIAILHASKDDMTWTPPDYATPLVGKAATWNGDQFEIESA